MGLDPNHLPEKLVNKIADPAEKKRVGPTMSEKIAKLDAKNEKQLRQWIFDFCEVFHNLVIVSAKPTVKSTIQKGAPDLFICGPKNRVLPMELKVGDNTLSDDQVKFHQKLTNANCIPCVVRDYATATRIITKFFHL